MIDMDRNASQVVIKSKHISAVNVVGCKSTRASRIVAMGHIM